MILEFYSLKYFFEIYNEVRNKFCDAVKVVNVKFEIIELYF